MSALADLIRREISQTGPITVARYMELCLGHPEHGYYVTRDPLGTAGDFTTAPEISQMFGEMIGAWAATVASGMADAAPRLIELGPGRGTLVADALRVLAQSAQAPEVWLVETSPALREIQAIRVPDAQWVARLEDVPEGPAIIIANEFLDALPVRQFLRAEEGWRERLVGLDEDQLVWGLSPALPGNDAAPVGAWREASAQAEMVTREIARRLDRAPGAALIVDYGYYEADRPPGPTLQAVRGHQKADPLAEPGHADLTWLIDFDRLAARLGPGSLVTEQGAFLARLGIGQRAAALAAARPDRADLVADDLERLTDTSQMGTLFKMVARVSAGLPVPPGFEVTA